ncbi:hypothetical protein [Vulgatibacter sp.]|uniref:hypothetical protein n=1 Tax=Vulgatibacter sp. TaxID=1971226 RepID=UPI003561DEF1
MHTLLLALSIALVGLLVPRGAAACSDALPQTYRENPALAEIDHVAPTGTSVRKVEVRRRIEPVFGDRLDGCAVGGGVGGSIRVEVAPATDDRSPVHAIGYEVEHVSGRVPGSFVLPQPAFVLDEWSGETLVLPLHEEDDDEVLDFQLRLVPVDEAGNRGPPSEPFRVHDEGVGCSVGGGGLTLAGAVVVLLALRRRIRRGGGRGGA